MSLRIRRVLVVALSASALAPCFGLGAQEFLGLEEPRVLAGGPSCTGQPGYPGSVRAWWPGDRHANDIIGSTNLTLAGGATFGGRGGGLGRLPSRRRGRLR
jgi:hypothetical protein